jgi:signal transduction histidine kinase
VLVILNDVSRIEERQERLLQAARLADVGQLAGGIAHEINTPLASIALRAESLERAAQDERLRAIDSFKNFPRYLKTIQEETFRCKRILGSLLEFARSRAPEIGPTDLNGVCDVAADLLAHELKVRHLTLEKRLDPELPRIEADEARITQVLVALLLNAFDASKRGGLIVIETGRPTARQVSLSVSDTGHGIDPEHRGRLFIPFFTTRPPGGGAGLGLAISHGVVAAHGGSIQVESTPGEGARFTVILPLRPGVPDAVAGAAAVAKP